MPRGRSDGRTLYEELALVADHAHANGYSKAAGFLDRTLAPKHRRAKHMAPPPKTPNLDRPPREHDVFRNLRTGWEAYVLGAPEDGYIKVLNGLRRSHVQVNRLIDSKLYEVVQEAPE